MFVYRAMKFVLDAGPEEVAPVETEWSATHDS
jgi:hypothetical protein